MSASKTPPHTNRKKKSKGATPSANQAAVFPGSEHDELTNIDGIDATAERALNIIGIRRFSDFRGYTPETLAQLLQTRTGLSIEAATIADKDWMVWAEILAEKNAAAPDDTDENQEAATATENASVEMPPAAKSEATPVQKIPEVIPQPSGDSTERPLAALNGRTDSSSLRPANPPATPAIPAEADFARSLKVAPSANLTQRDERLITTPQANGEIKKQKMAPAIKHEQSPGDWALQIQSAKFAPIEMPAQPNSAAVRRLQGEIQCKLSGSPAVIAAIDRLLVCAQIHAVDTLTGEHKLLASQYGLLLPDQVDYSWWLEFAAPRLGRYQLQVVVFLLNTDSKIAFYQGPVLRVIA